MTQPSPAYKAKVSEVLDPEFCADLQAQAKEFDASMTDVDNSKWAIAQQVNDWWQEQSRAFSTKDQYYAECCRVMNLKTKHKRFGDSGETLRRWCETVESYAQYPHAELFLDELSFDHLYQARKLYKREKVKSPLEALARATKEKWTADEMVYHFDPPQVPNEYDEVTGWIDARLSPKAWAWLNDADKIKTCVNAVKTIDEVVRTR